MVPSGFVAYIVTSSVVAGTLTGAVVLDEHVDGVVYQSRPTVAAGLVGDLHGDQPAYGRHEQVEGPGPPQTGRLGQLAGARQVRHPQLHVLRGWHEARDRAVEEQLEPGRIGHRGVHERASAVSERPTRIA